MGSLSTGFLRLVAAAGLGLAATVAGANGAQACPEHAQTEGITMAGTAAVTAAGTAADLWIACEVTLVPPDSGGAAAFCAPLAEELARGSGGAVHQTGQAAIGAKVVHLTLRQTGSARASAEIATFVQKADGLHPLARQTLFLTVQDAGLTPGSTRALAFPILQMLKD